MSRGAEQRVSPFWLAAGTGVVGVSLGAAAVMLGQAQREPRDPTPPPVTASIEPVTSGWEPEPSPVAASSSPTLVDAIARTRDAVVNVNANGTLGAGVIVHPRGIVLTNYHVIAKALGEPPAGVGDAAALPAVRARFENGRELSATVLVADSIEDLAILRLQPTDEGETFRSVPLGRSSELRLGEEVFAIGNPLGLNHSVSRGIVSGLDRTGLMRTLPLIQLDASINLGNSGGPLFDLHGSLVGIVTLRRHDAEGIAFAVPVDHVRGFLDAVRDPEAPRRSGEIGVEIRAVEPDDALLRLGYRAGLRVGRVLPDSTAQAAGLREGDLIVEVRGKRLDGLPGADQPATLGLHLVSAVRSLFPGERLPLGVLRDGAVVQIPVEIGEATSDRQVAIDAEELLGLRLRPSSGQPVVLGLSSTVRRPGMGRTPKDEEIVRLLDERITSVEELGATLARLRELVRQGQVGFWVLVGLRDPGTGETRPYHVLIQ